MLEPAPEAGMMAAAEPRSIPAEPPAPERALAKPGGAPVVGKPAPRPPTPQHPVGMLPAVQSVLHLLVVALFLIAFTVQPIRIPSESMEPTLLVGDFLLLDKAAVAQGPGPLLPPAGIHRGDLIVFHDPVDDPSVHLVKRVVALPGDRIRLHHGLVVLNGEPQPEPYVRFSNARRRLGSEQPAADPFRDEFPTLYAMDPRVNPDWWIHLRGLVRQADGGSAGEITVPAGHYFVLGDNRDNSDDSRYWGFVPRDAIVGEPLLIYFSARDPRDGYSAGAPHRSLVRWARLFHVAR